ncbi:sensor domain-containing diguanylate cyclase [Ferdinandcohnia quinoae]|uniref:Sensor domain-containing diguanylate cyclase n=1 Tax=Fredinandcohnia quinoae TaxID=2918902 RepID=A0AAW5EAW8_9BACI|nr:sensor domain-containing diguanylate cyclase [Fredinandcohnia sp. SECRCQ15]MCH1626815.1 sensor domain-containing diguanylate cyclase [Fredinandcohnia sp. SECRCQ15]
MFKKRGIRLQFAISLLVIMAIISTIIVSWHSSERALGSTLKEKYLESNYQYAKKLSLSTSGLLNYMQENIIALGKISSQHSFSQNDLDEWKSSNNNYFNSIFITDKYGVIEIISPSIIKFESQVKAGMKLQSDVIKKALTYKNPFISEPYRGKSGQLIILISAPIFDNTGNYGGLVAGTIYLESDNILNSMLNENEHENGSYVYVVDQTGRIIYHPNASRINDVVRGNKAINEIKLGNNGSSQITNSEGDEFFAGYAFEEKTRWGIVSQTPISVIEEPLQRLSEKMIINALPLLLLILIIAWILTNNLARPLNKLAKFSEDAINHDKPITSLNNMQFKSNIYEVNQLYHHISKHITLLNDQIQLDGLTGIANRRTFDQIIKVWISNKIPFTLIMIDIDHFKKVNDTYGHLVGDDVLKYLSKMMVDVSNEGDLCFRYGGEEFGILIKDKETDDAYKIAERLRITVSEAPSPTGKPITISAGISSYHGSDLHPKEIIEKADTALYQSKHNGRNRITIFDS